MDLHGSLKIFEPISVMQMLNLSLTTGELLLEVEGNSAAVYFLNGSVTFAEIFNRPVKLGEYLVKHRYLSKKALQKILKKKNKGKRLGTLLMEKGLIKEAVLQEAIKEQIKEVIYEVVRWRDGVFTFVHGKMPEHQDILIDIPLDSLMLEGMKRMDEEEGKDSQ